MILALKDRNIIPDEVVTLKTVLVCLLFYYFGTLLPDADSKTSILGRIIKLPGGHRTWTHSIYPLVFWYICGQSYYPCKWLFMGYLFHLIADSFSKCGVCWFLPFTGYQKFGDSGAKIKKGHFWGYKTGTAEETIALIGIIMCSCFCAYVSYKLGVYDVLLRYLPQERSFVL